MTASALLDSRINDAHRNGRTETFEALKLLRDPIAEIEAERDQSQQEKSPPRQFALNLQEDSYHNFFAYGALERHLESARLIHRIEYGKEKCILVFEEYPSTLKP